MRLLYIGLLCCYTFVFFVDSLNEATNWSKNEDTQCPYSTHGTTYSINCVHKVTNENILTIDVTKNKLTFQCLKSFALNSTFLRPIADSSINYVVFQFCALPHDGFYAFLNRLNIENVTQLKFEYANDSATVWNSDVFNNMANLERLSLSYNNVTKVAINVFEHTPYLNQLFLERTYINWSAGIFDSLASLRLLRLADSKLTTIPEHLFHNLSNLKELELWSNKISIVNESTFTGLINLKLLELRNNKISLIAKDAFKSVPKLTTLILAANNLSEINYSLFEKNAFLETLKFSYNPLSNISEHAFRGLTSLKLIWLDNCRLEYLPEALFTFSKDLSTIRLDHNRIKDLPERVFNQLTNVLELYLNNNVLSALSPNIFSNLSNLEILNLENNFIKTINDDMFSKLFKLKQLSLAHNNLTYVGTGTFFTNYESPITSYMNPLNVPLRKAVHHSLNDLYFRSTVFSKLNNLERLDLSYNAISHIKSNLPHLIKLKTFNVSHNNFTKLSFTDLQFLAGSDVTVDMEHNKISTVDFNVNISEWRRLVIQLDKNPFKCDCNLYDFIKYLNSGLWLDLKSVIEVHAHDARCASPNTLHNVALKNVAVDELTCAAVRDLDINYTSCPERCECLIRPFDASRIVNCTNAQLKMYPTLSHQRLHHKYKYSQTVLILAGNNLTDGPHPHLMSDYDNVTTLVLSDNKITNINWLPPNVKNLHLHNNRLSSMSKVILEKLEDIKVSLSGNPWICNCNLLPFIIFLRRHLQQVTDISARITCNNIDGKPMNIYEYDLCEESDPVIYLIITFLIALTVCTFAFAVYVRYKVEVKVWLYSRGLCLWWITEDEVDKNKVYDAFISYSHVDEDFVTENLLPVLEGGTHPYKLCLHYRNWVPGEFIAKQVVDSVQKSRRTIVILSPNFLNSVWSKLEFRTAHTEAMNEGRVRVIVVLYGDIKMSDLDDELKAYLKSNTYIKWGDTWFWDKIRYALPHSTLNGLVHSKAARHASIMTAIDEKFSKKQIENIVLHHVPSANSMKSIHAISTFNLESGKLSRSTD